MSCNSSSSSRDREPTGILPSITYFLLASNGIGAIFRAYAGGNYSMAAFIIIIYFGFLLMESCLSAYQRLPPHEESRTKRFLKLAIWLLFSAIMFGFAHQIAPFLSLAAGLLLYATAAACSAFLLCVCIICEGISNKDCAKCCTEEKRYFSCCACHVEEVIISDEKLIQDYDSILEKV